MRFKNLTVEFFCAFLGGFSLAALTDAAVSSSSSNLTQFEDEPPVKNNGSGLKIQNGRCLSCELEEEARIRTEAIKAEILRQLGLKEVPKITKKSASKTETIFQIMNKELMQQDSPLLHDDDDQDDKSEHSLFRPSINTIVSSSRRPPEWLGLEPETEVKYFYFDRQDKLYRVGEAVLWFYLKSSNDWQKTTRKMVLKASQIIKHVSGGFTNHIDISKKEVTINRWRGRWIKLDVTKTVKEWFRYPLTNLGLLLKAYDDQHHEIDVDLKSSASKPMFISVVPEKSRRRTKRKSNPTCTEASNNTTCCLHPLTVNFIKLGWDFVTEPKSFEANYCKGACRPPYSTAYTKLIKDMRQNNKDTTACCVPISLSSITMHYKISEYGSSYVATIKEVVANDCKCF
ncbi:Uncharacterised protein g7962 [Pycnogonum litorale]